MVVANQGIAIAGNLPKDRLIALADTGREVHRLIGLRPVGNLDAIILAQIPVG